MTKRKDNDVICNGAIAPQMADIMEAYNAYVNAVTGIWYAWAAVSGLKYYNDQYWAMINHINQPTK